MRQGASHFVARRAQFFNKRVRMRTRLHRLHQTVYASVLHGAGDWTLSASLLAQLERWELRLGRRMLQAPRLEGEQGREYISRCNKLVKEHIAAASRPSLPQLAVKRVHAWAGHLARLPQDRWVAKVLRFGDKAFFCGRDTSQPSGRFRRCHRMAPPQARTGTAVGECLVRLVWDRVEGEDHRQGRVAPSRQAVGG